MKPFYSEEVILWWMYNTHCLFIVEVHFLLLSMYEFSNSIDIFECCITVNIIWLVQIKKITSINFHRIRFYLILSTYVPYKICLHIEIRNSEMNLIRKYFIIINIINPFIVRDKSNTHSIFLTILNIYTTKMEWCLPYWHMLQFNSIVHL